PLIRRLVGDEASVSAQANVGAHFSQRQQIFQYPNKVGEVDIVILRLASPTRNIAQDPNLSADVHKCITGNLDAHLQMNRHEYIKSIEQLLKTKEYGMLLWQDPWLVLSRNGWDDSNLGEVKRKLAELKAEWKIGPGERGR
ncbi:MAG: hypothetical protein KAR13_11090, partial [Desulfobulbaceae bacterium]|nr:hypothetical protein [Desulfobulbaceae bacterium]